MEDLGPVFLRFNGLGPNVRVVDPTLYQLCQAQMNLLVQSLGVTTGGIYWAEAEEQSPQWMPILIYPVPEGKDTLPVLPGGRSPEDQSLETESGMIEGILEELQEESFPGGLEAGDSSGLAGGERSETLASVIAEGDGFAPEVAPEIDPEEPLEVYPSGSAGGALAPGGSDREGPMDNYPLWRPLTSEGTVLGLLVLERIHEPWSLGEQQQVAEVVKTLEAAFTLVKRQQWLEASFADQERFYEGQRDRLHDLLHQFKNPLTAIRTFGKLLLRRFEGDERATTVAGYVLRESDRLQGMLKNFGEVVDLDPMDGEPVSEIAPPLLLPGGDDGKAISDGGTNEGASPLALLPTGQDDRAVDLNEVLSGLVETATVLAQEATVELQVVPWGTLPTVGGDRRTLQEVIGNVIDNALKYTPAGGRVQVQATVGVPGEFGGGEECGNGEKMLRSPNSKSPPSVPQVAVMVRDSGLGISAEDLHQLFARRFRGEKGDSEIPGTGLGLAIVRDTLEAIGGAIGVFSPAIALEAQMPRLPESPENIESFDGSESSYPKLVFTEDGDTTGTSVILWLPIDGDT